jgi:transposase
VDEAERTRIAELEAVVAAQAKALGEKDAQIARLEAQVRELLERLNRNSGNSSKPPSSDPPSVRAERQAKAKGKSGKKPGGQPGHKGTQRALLAPEHVDEVIDHFPAECENCWVTLPKTPDPAAQRYQTTELPPTKLFTAEHRVHTVTCACCGIRTTAGYEIPPAFGPRLWSVVALLTGVYHLSRRSAVTLLSDVLGVKMSLGAVSAIEERVSEALAPAVEEAWQRVEQSPVKHADGTSWYQRSAARALWTIATTVATVFKIIASGDAKTLAPLFGDKSGILVSDRASALRFWAMEMRQVCWAHLLRKFISFSERGGPAGVFGKELLGYVGIMFTYWDDLKAGRLERAAFRSSMEPVRTKFEAVLERAVASKLEHVAGSCEDILEHRAALWTFVDKDGVEPTNNHAERELRAFVLWRRRSFGTQSERGNVFAARVMTVAHTARKQSKNVLEFLVGCCTAARDGTKGPSLFAA